MDKNHQFTIYPQRKAPFRRVLNFCFTYFLVQVGIYTNGFDLGRKRGVKEHSNLLIDNNLNFAILDKCA